MVANEALAATSSLFVTTTSGLRIIYIVQHYLYCPYYVANVLNMLKDGDLHTLGIEMGFLCC